MPTNAITIDNDNNAADAIDNGNGGVASVSPIRFNRGDLVHIHNAPSHFSNDCDAIVEGSYSDLYGRDYNSNHYSLFVRGKGSEAWFTGSELTLLETNRLDLITVWQAEIDTDKTQKKDLDWIFAHGEQVLESAHGATIESLASCLGIADLGPDGEGFTYYRVALSVLSLAEPFLRTGDKDGWLALCESITLGVVQ